MLSDGIWTYDWEHGRQLASMTDGTTTWTYTYNSDGLRTKRTNGSTTYHYVYTGDKLTQMTVTTTVDSGTPTIETLYFAYDASGVPMAVTYNGTTYYYVTNLQGDVVAILDNTGTEVAGYTYDAWGNILSTTGSLAQTLGEANPLRYRGYVFDNDTGLYYLQSRYYDPELGRFVNADAFASTGQGLLGNNMFAYCLNNPVRHADNTGNYATSINPNSSCYDVHSSGGGGGIPIPLPGLVDIIDEAATSVYMAVSYAYRQYTRETKATLGGMLPGNYPVTHHIVPYGDFSLRSEAVRQQLQNAQEIMGSAGVNPQTDPLNQVALSASYHMSLHTDAYILMVTSPIIALGENATQEQIYAVLFDLRIIIAANDPYAYGY